VGAACKQSELPCKYRITNDREVRIKTNFWCGIQTKPSNSSSHQPQTMTATPTALPSARVATPCRKKSGSRPFKKFPHLVVQHNYHDHAQDPIFDSSEQEKQNLGGVCKSCSSDCSCGLRPGRSVGAGLDILTHSGPSLFRLRISFSHSVSYSTLRNVIHPGRRL